MKAPTVQREGDSWVLTWDEHGIGMGVERLRDKSDGLKAEVTVESGPPHAGGRVLGPVDVNLLNSRGQAEFSNACHKRVNGLGEDEWRAMVVQACAIVARQYREPTPTIDLSTMKDGGPVQYLVPNLIPRGETTVLYGDGEGGKSLLALRIAFSIATGQDVPWGHRVDQGNVLYLDWETNATTVASRLRRIAGAMHTEVPEVFYRQCFRSLSDELPHVREEIARKHIVLVIIDSIGFAASGALVEDETARSAMNALRQMTPATRLVVAHVSKGAADSPGPVKPFGSAFFWNGMRSGIEVRRAEESQMDSVIDVGLYHRKNNDGKHAKAMGLSVIFGRGEDDGILFEETEIADIAELAARTPLSGRIRNMLRFGGKTAEELADELEVKENVVRVTLGRMQGVTRLEPGGGRGKESVWGLSE